MTDPAPRRRRRHSQQPSGFSVLVPLGAARPLPTTHLRATAAACSGIGHPDAATTRDRHGFSTSKARTAARIFAAAAMMKTRSQLPVDFWMKFE